MLQDSLACWLTRDGGRCCRVSCLDLLSRAPRLWRKCSTSGPPAPPSRHHLLSVTWPWPLFLTAQFKRRVLEGGQLGLMWTRLGCIRCKGYQTGYRQVWWRRCMGRWNEGFGVYTYTCTRVCVCCCCCGCGCCLRACSVRACVHGVECVPGRGMRALEIMHANTLVCMHHRQQTAPSAADAHGPSDDAVARE